AAAPGCRAVPIAIADEVAAVLYADQGTGDSRADEIARGPSTPLANASSSAGAPSQPGWPEALEVLARHAARCLEALTALKAARAVIERPNGHTPANVRTRGRATTGGPAGPGGGAPRPPRHATA